MWAIKAVLLGLKKDLPVSAEIVSKSTTPGTKYLAFIGTGKNNNINSALGNKKAKATKIPYKAPEAPTIEKLKEV
jgi:hypothetical protein